MRQPHPSRLRPFLEPVAGAAFLVLWVIAEIGRHPHLQDLGFYVMLGLYSLAIAIARVAPRAALGIVVVVPFLQMLGAAGVTPLQRLVAPLESTSWPIAGAAVIVAFVVGLSAGPPLRVAAAAVGILQAALVGFAVASGGRWASWTGTGETVIGRGGIALQWALILSGVAAVLFLAALGLGVALQLGGPGVKDRMRLERVEADLEVAGVELRIAQERSGIAQEVHDVLAHSLAVVVAVADGSRFLRQTRPETTEEALREIAGTARSALLDLRGLIEELTDDAHRPQPNLADLPALIRGMAATGMHVDLRTAGRPGALTPSQQLSVYRIVQESLTNALKHTRGTATVDVSFVWEGPGLALTVRSRGSEVEPGPTSTLPSAGPRGGFGVGSMQERARLAGGWLTAEHMDPEEGDATDGHLVTAFLPTYGEHPTDGRRPATAPVDGAPGDDAQDDRAGEAA
ncbi:Sensor histidine kinase DesK [Clavibacter michiganensis]|uniref:histidine kinase n=1 Tax=Clavibacter michiganensis TaxID=28447 RepID=A0A251YE72_9MICO|nr:histidine kinase [Clavibacter michiganensis]OUE22388.1 Sensor histidine kinase DesK [Clavibacter michiganensis]